MRTNRKPTKAQAAVLGKPAGRERPLTDQEAARELFVAGYHQALDDVAAALALPPDAGFLAKLRAKAAKVQAAAALARAKGNERAARMEG